MKQCIVINRVSENLQEGIKLVESGMSVSEAARLAVCNPHSLAKILKAGTITALDGTVCVNNEAFQMWKEAIDVYLSESLSLVEFRRRYGFKKDQLDRNLPLFTTKPANDNRISFDRSVFSVIDTAEKAYWYGFLLADGGLYRNEVRLKLGEVDRTHLVKYCQFVGLDPESSIKSEVHKGTGIHFTR